MEPELGWPPRPPHRRTPIAVKEFRIAKQTYMAKSEIHRRTLNIFSNLWWKFMPGTTIKVKWPNGPMIQEHIDQYKTDEELLSADPNDHYRPALEQNVGKQGWDWDWRIGSIKADNGFGTTGYDTLLIKMRKGRDEYATIATLKWG